MTRGSWTARAALAGLGAFGIALAHRAAYLLAAPDAHAHQELLQSTGHRYWPLGGALLVALLVGSVGFGLSARFGRDGRKTLGFIASGMVLAAIQVTGFLLMEIGERVLFASHHDVASLLGEPVLWLGLALQLVVAFVGALVLRGLSHAVVFIQTLIRKARVPRPVRGVIGVHDSQTVASTLSPTCGGLSRRGPPSPALI